MKRRHHPEQNLQKAICRYLSVALPPDAFYFAVPNGGWRTKAEAGIMRATGQKSGVPDLVLIYQKQPFGIEAKSMKGVLSPAQKLTHQHLTRAGMQICVCRSVDDVQKALDGWAIPIKARVFGWSAAA